MRTLISETVNHIGKKVLVKGWVQIRRDHGKLIFFNLRDRSGFLQIVINASVSESAYEVAKEIRPEFAVEIVGQIKERPRNTRAKEFITGAVELEAQEIKILSKAATLPFDMGGENLSLELPTLLDHRSLALRHPQIGSIFYVQESLVKAFREIAKDIGCTEIFVPTISASATEGGAEVFGLDYYDHKAYLTQSPQLYKQIMVGVFERVFTISHAYRAEPSVTTRHLAEVVQLDCEVGFIENFDELLSILEQVGMSVIRKATEESKELLNFFKIEKAVIPNQVPRLTLKQAQDVIYKETNGERDVRGEKDLNSTDEVILGEWAKNEHKSDLATITHFPTKAKPFYAMPDPKNPEISLSYDLLFRGIEIASGSQRINDYDQLINAMKERNLNPNNFSMYLQAFKYGIPPEGGFSFGLERMTMKLLNLANIRQASLFPRDMERVDERL